MSPAEQLTFEAYAALPELSASKLKAARTSMRLFHLRMREPLQDNDTLRRGRAIHTAVLEPEKFASQYVTWGGKVRRGKVWDQFQADNDGRTILTVAQYDTANRVADAVNKHPIAGQIFAETPRGVELSLRWEHVRTGRKFKARIDWLASTLVDLKSCADPSPHKFAANSARLGYHMQLAIYLDGLTACGFGEPPAQIVAAQSVEPYDVVVYNVPPSVLAAGHQELEQILDRLAQCEADQHWPGIADDQALDLYLPAWAEPETDEPDFGGLE